MSRKDPSFTFADVLAPTADKGSDNKDPTVPNLRLLNEHAYPDASARKPAAPEPTPRGRLAEMRRLSEFIKQQRQLEALKADDDKTN